MTAAAGAHDQQLVLYYAASVFMSFLVGLLAMVLRPPGRPIQIVLPDRSVVAFTLIVQHPRGKRAASPALSAHEHDA